MALAALAALDATAASQIVQLDDGSFSGYLADILCWELKVGIDGADMINAPETHTVHCMRDIGDCIDSGFGVLEQPASGSGPYSLKYTFDQAGNAMALDLLKKTRKRNDYIVSVKGDVSGGKIAVTEIVEYGGGGAAGGGAGGAPGAARATEAGLVAHFCMMAVAFGALFPWGVALARSGRGARGAAPDAWFKAHRRVQIAGWLLQLGGLVAAVVYVQNRGGGHFNSPHTRIGIAVVAITTAQPLLAALRPHAPEDGATKSGAREAWERAHKVVGIAILVGGIVAASTGIASARSLGYGGEATGSATALLCFGLVTAACYMALHWAGKGAALTGAVVSALGGSAPPAERAVGAHDAAFDKLPAGDAPSTTA